MLLTRNNTIPLPKNIINYPENILTDKTICDKHKINIKLLKRTNDFHTELYSQSSSLTNALIR